MPRVDGLGDKETRAVDEYLVCLNRTQAYLRAGYKPGKSPTITSELASDLFAKPRIAAAVDARLAARAEKTGITAERVVRELAKVGFASMRQFVQIDDQGQPQIDLRGANEDALDALAEVTTEAVWKAARTAPGASGRRGSRAARHARGAARPAMRERPQ